MIDTTLPLAGRLAALAHGLTECQRRPARPRVEAFLDLARVTFEAVNKTEAAHVTFALEQTGFDFVAAQDRLAGCLEDFTRLLNEVRDSLAGMISEGEKNALAELAFLVENAPLTSVADIEAIRVARQSRAGRQKATIA